MQVSNTKGEGTPSVLLYILCSSQTPFVEQNQQHKPGEIV